MVLPHWGNPLSDDPPPTNSGARCPRTIRLQVFCRTYPDSSGWVNVLVLVLCLPMLWMLVTHWPHGFFTSLFKYASLLTFIRCLTTTATVLPPNYQCADPDLTAVSPYLVGHCVDKMFSNHTALSLTVVLLYWRYGVLKGAWLCAAFALQVLSSFTHIPTRSHYTIDVLVAYLVALAIFFMFDLLSACVPRSRAPW